MVSDAIPFLGWLGTVRGYTAKMKRTVREVDQVLGSWVDEHRRKRFSGSMNEAEQDFNHVMLSVIEDGQFSDHDHDTVINATCLVCFFFFPWSNSINLHTLLYGNSKPPS